MSNTRKRLWCFSDSTVKKSLVVCIPSVTRIVRSSIQRDVNHIWHKFYSLERSDSILSTDIIRNLNVNSNLISFLTLGSIVKKFQIMKLPWVCGCFFGQKLTVRMRMQQEMSNKAMRRYGCYWRNRQIQSTAGLPTATNMFNSSAHAVFNKVALQPLQCQMQLRQSDQLQSLFLSTPHPQL